MPKHDVHLYVQVRVKFSSIEADTKELAIEEALTRYQRTAGGSEFFGITQAAHNEGVTDICDSEDGPREVLVDVLGDEDFEESRSYSIHHDDGGTRLVDHDERDAEIARQRLQEGSFVSAQSPEAQQFINEAAVASERFGDDELERFAEEQRKKGEGLAG